MATMFPGAPADVHVDGGGSAKEPLPLLVVVLGPTGSGKTALSLVLGQHFDGEIVNCDSVALYREFEIGTAKPSPEERTRVPHHLFDRASPTQEITAGEYARIARGTLRQISARKRLPIVVGGTGLYLRALLEGLFAGPARSEELRERLRKRQQARGSQHLHRILRRLDPEAARKKHANDVPKLIRAIEVCILSRRPMSKQLQQGRDALQGFAILRIGLDPDRARLYQRINRRVQTMFDQGLVEETEALFKKYGEAAPSIKSIGYKQVVQLLKGEISRDAAIGAIQQAHRNYAKRQMTWFRREPDVSWINEFGDQPEAIERASELIENHLHPRTSQS